MPDTFKGASDKETIEKLWKAQVERAPPKAATEYTVELVAELKGLIDPANDKVLPMYRETALKHGLTQAQFNGVINDLFGGMAKAGMIKNADVVKQQELIERQNELAALADGKGDRASQLQAGVKRVQDLVERVKGLATRQEISTAEADAIAGSLLSKHAVTGLEKLLAKLPAEHGVQAGGRGAGASFDAQEAFLRQMYPTMYAKGNGAAA